MIVFILPPGGQLCNQVISHNSDHEPLKVHQHQFVVMYLLTFYRAYFYVKDTFVKTNKCDFKLLFYRRNSVLMSYKNQDYQTFYSTEKICCCKERHASGIL